MLVGAFVYVGIFLRSLICLRGYQCGMLRKYVWFYSYIFAVLLADAVVYFILSVRPALYADAYWPAQFITLAFGCGLIVEIFKHALAFYPGAERFAKAACLITFAMIFVFAFGYGFLAPQGRSPLLEIDVSIERDLRACQILFFAAILAVISRYGISVGRNLRGLMYGYGLYLGFSIVTLAVRFYVGRGFNEVWRVAQPLSLDASLILWLRGFWRYDPAPAPSVQSRLEEDYQALAAMTRTRIAALRSYIGRSTEH